MMCNYRNALCYTVISINVVGLKLQAYESRPNGAMGIYCNLHVSVEEIYKFVFLATFPMFQCQGGAQDFQKMILNLCTFSLEFHLGQFVWSCYNLLAITCMALSRLLSFLHGRRFQQVRS